MLCVWSESSGPEARCEVCGDRVPAGSPRVMAQSDVDCSSPVPVCPACFLHANDDVEGMHRAMMGMYRKNFPKEYAVLAEKERIMSIMDKKGERGERRNDERKRGNDVGNGVHGRGAGRFRGRAHKGDDKGQENAVQVRTGQKEGRGQGGKGGHGVIRHRRRDAGRGMDALRHDVACGKGVRNDR